MKHSLHIYMRDGKTFVFEPENYTDYEYRGSIFVVYNHEQWIGVFNMSEVSCAIFEG